VRDLELAAMGEPHGWLRRLVLPEARAHPGHAPDGKVTGELAGAFVVELDRPRAPIGRATLLRAAGHRQPRGPRVARVRLALALGAGRPHAVIISSSSPALRREGYMTTVTRFLLAFMMVVSVSACDAGVGTGGDVVGGPCTSAADCEYRCQTGGDFPQGTCVKPCNTDSDCPRGTHCIDKDNGICLLACTRPSDCRGGYNCEGKTNRTHGGDSLVCIH
jgi:hypothetical protein